MLANELSMMVMSLASLATLVPDPMESPTWATLRAGASLVPSPVTATTWLRACKASTNRFLSIGRARAMIFRWSTRCSSSSFESAAKVRPSMISSSGVSWCQMPICRPISRAVAILSPVTILMSMPAWTHSSMAAFTSSLTGSSIPTTPMKQRLWAVSPSRPITSSSSTIW